MGVKDIVTKDYVKENIIFADAFNKYIYKGKQVIEAEKLKPLDTSLTGNRAVHHQFAGSDAVYQIF